MARNIRLYPWFQFFRNLLFWQAIWFLYFQKELSAAEAILLAAIYDVATTVFEVPSGYVSDRIGRRITLVVATGVYLFAALLLAVGETFYVFAAAQACLGLAMALASGTDTSLLYESLEQEDRADEVERQERRAWRFGFSGLALSALSGGLLGAISPVWAFLATAAAAAVALIISIRFEEPIHRIDLRTTDDEPTRRDALIRAIKHPTLAWLFVFTAAMYTFSHVPFVFGQPFILESLASMDVEIDASIVSGAVVSAMMLISVATSWLAPTLRQQFGVGAVFLIALGMQIGLIAALAMSNHPIVIGLLFLRMVPDSLARPYILAHIHPLLNHGYRATYLSVQNLVARLLFAMTLILSSAGASNGAQLAYADMRAILAIYAFIGFATFLALFWRLRHAGLPSATSSHSSTL